MSKSIADELLERRSGLIAKAQDIARKGARDADCRSAAPRTWDAATLR